MAFEFKEHLWIFAFFCYLLFSLILIPFSFILLSLQLGAYIGLIISLTGPVIISYVLAKKWNWSDELVKSSVIKSFIMTFMLIIIRIILTITLATLITGNF